MRAPDVCLATGFPPFPGICKTYFEVENILPQSRFCRFQEKVENHSPDTNQGCSSHSENGKSCDCDWKCHGADPGGSRHSADCDWKCDGADPRRSRDFADCDWKCDGADHGDDHGILRPVTGNATERIRDDHGFWLPVTGNAMS